VRLPEPGGTQAWLTPILPHGAGPAVLDELDLPRPVLEQPNDTARVLAATLKSCWPDPSGPLWPGITAPFGQVVATFEVLTGHDEVVSHRAVVAALRRLSWSGWLLWDEETRTVRLGPRVATWAPTELSTLRELWRSIPTPAEGTDPGLPAATQAGVVEAGVGEVEVGAVEVEVGAGDAKVVEVGVVEVEETETDGDDS
jgi:hypothetical protein